GAEVPADRTIDGRDITSVLFGETDESPHEAFFYYRADHLEAVRVGRWKLHLAAEALYDLAGDPGETTDVAAANPEVVAELQIHAERGRADLGDGRLGIEGTGRRPVGEVPVAEAVPLTRFDPDHPYYQAEYDLPDRG